MFSIPALPACLALTTLAMACHTATAQTIERVKLTDNDLSCQQIYAESQQMTPPCNWPAPACR